MKQRLFKYLCYFFLVCPFVKGYTQILNPIAFTYSTSFTSYGKINAIAEDTVTSLLHFQNSCDCGVGPANKWTALSHINLGNNLIKTPYVYYGPLGVINVAKNIHTDNSKLYINDQNTYRRFSTAAYTQDWAVNFSSPEKALVSIKRNDSIFTVIDDGLGCMKLQINNAINGSVIPFNTIDCSGSLKGHINGTVLSAKLFGGKIYLCGGFTAYDGSFNILDSNAVIVNVANGNMQALNWQTNDTIKDLEIYNGKIHIAGNFTNAKATVRNHFASFDLIGNLQSPGPSFNGNVEQIEVYDNYLFALGKFTSINGNVINPSGDFILKAVNLVTNSIMSWSLPFSVIPALNDEFALENVRNRLYYFSRVSSGFINAVCLPPVKSTTGITTATTTICEQTQNVLFSVPPFLYANNYNWFYTGTGAVLSMNNNSVTINFNAGATSGKIKMVASSVCGGRADTLSLSLTIVPRPGAIASLVDDTLNCFKPKVPILGNSPTTGVGYTWNGPAGYTSTQKNDSTAKYVAGTYSLTVTNLTTGCTSTASLNFTLDTLKPNVTLPLPPYIIPCNPNFLLLTGSSTTTPSLIQWKNVFSPTLYPNPYSATVAGVYQLIVKDQYNGCSDSKTISVTASAAGPTVAITSHTNYVNFSIPVDSITCLTPSVQISASATPSNCTILWKDKTTNAISANPITVSSQGNYMPIVTRLDNSCVDSSKIVLIAQDIIPPNVSILTPSPNINCSYSTATLNAVVSPSNALSQWTGPSSFVSTNPAVATVQGKYYFTATDPANGCVKKDSINLGYANILVVNAGNDTVVCKNSVVPLTAAVAGTVSTLSYVWNNGANTQNTIVSNAVSANYVVNVNGGGCNGTDTIRVIIPADIQDSIVASKGCTGNSGNLVIYAKGGIPPYQYSVNGSAFTSVNTFSNLAFATHNVVIKDSIGCTRTTTASINQNSNSTVPVFIASTQNFKGDTVVFVDLTVPKADSIQWLLPNIATIIGGDMFSPVVVFADTGIFSVTMKAYYGTCMISASKLIHILPYDSAYATLSNFNGIKLLNVFPNPNTGVFNVNIEFYKKQNVSVQIWDANAQKHYQNNFVETDHISLPVSLPQLQNGTYILRVIGEYSSKHFNIVISK